MKAGAFPTFNLIEILELGIENGIPRRFGKHSLDVFFPLKRIKDVRWTYVATRDHAVYP